MQSIVLAIHIKLNKANLIDYASHSLLSFTFKLGTFVAVPPKVGIL